MNIDAWKDWMRGQDCIVVAPGPSSLEMPTDVYETHWTIAVNRALPYARADIGVCIERDNRDVCWRIVEANPPIITFSQSHKGRQGICFIDMDLSVWLEDDGQGVLRLPMSPFYAAAVGVHMGFERIGLIGVDLYKAQYPSERFKVEWEEAWTRLALIAERRDCLIRNLNPASRLDCIPKGKLDELHAKTHLSGLRRSTQPAV